jgi:hypothetical protein
MGREYILAVALPHRRYVAFEVILGEKFDLVGIVRGTSEVKPALTCESPDDLGRRLALEVLNRRPAMRDILIVNLRQTVLVTDENGKLSGLRQLSTAGLQSVWAGYHGQLRLEANLGGAKAG